MPVQTAIQTRRGTASSWTSTNPTLAAGEIGFETDTGKFKIGTGSTAWASLPYAAIDAGLLAAKGDLVTATANDTPAVLTVGSNGETLVADSSTSTGLRWQGNYAAGKNKIINGDFQIWQRGTSFTPAAGAYWYNCDRWRTFGSTATISRQTFTPGTAPVAGYEGQYFIRVNNSAANPFISQPIEDVRTLAGQTVTISFWAKASSAVTSSGLVSVEQNFGSGGSATVYTTLTNTLSFTTSWARYSVTGTVPSVSGKTIGAGSNLDIVIAALGSGNYNKDIDFWGVQVEAGNVATAFQTATGTLAGELNACMRYYEVLNMSFISRPAVVWTANSAARSFLQYSEKRGTPSISFDGNGGYRYVSNNGNSTSQTLTATDINTNSCNIGTSSIYGSVGAGWIDGNGSSGYAAKISAEL